MTYFALLVDFGSTFTKVALVDLIEAQLLARAQAVTTVDTNIMIGLGEAVREIRRAVPTFEPGDRHVVKLACSSAAGGLRLVVIGLVPSLTLEAARQAALGAGAKIVGSYHHKLTTCDISQIEQSDCDMILLTGGTDGGNEDCIRHNAGMLADSRVVAPIVVAGNRVVAGEVSDTLQSAGKDVTTTENVLPTLDAINTEPVRGLIRDLFVKRIMRAKGLGEAQDYFGGNVLMPTPMAVLKGAELLAKGTKNNKGWGEIVVIDVGGATTDVHSIAEGRPARVGVTLKGVPAPYVQRTVEGDLGIRHNAERIVEQAGASAILDDLRRIHPTVAFEEGELLARLANLARDVGRVPQTEEEVWLDIGLARAAVRIAITRHAATLRPVCTPEGEKFIQLGKDLTSVRMVIGTGGVFAHGPDPELVLRAATYDPSSPLSLRPKADRFVVDRHYILYAIGLLGHVAADVAGSVGKKYLHTE